MTVIWMTNQGSEPIHQAKLAANQMFPLTGLLLRRTRRCRLVLLLNPGGTQNSRREEYGSKAPIEDIGSQRAVSSTQAADKIGDGSIPVSMIQGFISEFAKSAYNSRRVMTCEGQANLRLRQLICNRAHGHRGDDPSGGRCWNNRNAHSGIDQRDECRHLSRCLDHPGDDSSLAQNSNQEIVESRSILSRIHDKGIPFEFAQADLFLCGKGVP